MIVNFKKEEVQYLNFLQVYWIFIVTELIELLNLLGMYEVSTDTYHTRKIFWSFVLFITVVSFLGLVGMACFLYISRFIVPLFMA